MSESFQMWAGKIALAVIPAFISVVLTSFVGIRLVEYRVEQMQVDTQRLVTKLDQIDDRSRENFSLHQIQSSVNDNILRSLERRDRENDEHHSRLWGAIDSLRGQVKRQ